MERRDGKNVQLNGYEDCKSIGVSAIISQMATDADLTRRIRHAESYPFARPACSYLFAEGGMRPLGPDIDDDRIPVVASGSNAAPDRLAAKFGTDGGVIPVTRARLHDAAVVFAGHFTAYGAIPATLCPSPGAVTHVWITWLTSAQLLVMHRSEGVTGCREVEQRYDYVELAGLDLHPERRPRIEKAGAYLSRRMLAPESRPLRFAEVLSRRSGLQAHPQGSALRLVHRLIDPAVSFFEFMGDVFSSAERRQALFRALTPHTLERGPI